MDHLTTQLTVSMHRRRPGFATCISSENAVVPVIHKKFALFRGSKSKRYYLSLLKMLYSCVLA